MVSRAADVITNLSTTRVTVIGKTDRVGAPSDNMILSRQRAEAVRDALVAAGVSADRIDTGWTGEDKPEVVTLNEDERLNRVVDVTVVKQPG